jgi:hypothetical protein
MAAVTTTTGGTAVLEKVFYTSVLVSDQDKALDFYTNDSYERAASPPERQRPGASVAPGAAEIQHLG